MTNNIRIGVMPLEKDASTCFELPNCKHPGAEVEILKMVYRLIGVNYTIIDVWKEFGEVYDFGAKQADGNWSGMIGLLQKDVVEKKKMYFTAFENQTLLCTPNNCNRFEQVIKRNPVRRALREKEITEFILKGGIYQSTVDSALLPGQLSWLTTDQKFLIVRDEDAPSYYVAYTFSKRHKKLLKKFNNALIEVLPAVSTITTGHGYNTRKIPFEIRTTNPRSPLSISNHLWQLFRSFIITSSRTDRHMWCDLILVEDDDAEADNGRTDDSKNNVL
ncbi:unnamed protein product [Caenorhabditis brenneri]